MSGEGFSMASSHISTGNGGVGFWLAMEPLCLESALACGHALRRNPEQDAISSP